MDNQIQAGSILSVTKDGVTGYYRVTNVTVLPGGKLMLDVEPVDPPSDLPTCP